MKLRKLLLTVALALVVMAVAAVAWRGRLSVAAVKRMAGGRLAADALNQLPDGLRVGL